MGTARQKVPLQLVPFQKENISTNQQQVAVPYLGGERVMASRWITKTLDVRTKQVDSTSKKG